MRAYDNMVSVIDEFRQRMHHRSEKVEEREIDRAIRVELGLLEVDRSHTSSNMQTTTPKNPGFFNRYLRISLQCGSRKIMSLPSGNIGHSLREGMGTFIAIAHYSYGIRRIHK